MVNLAELIRDVPDFPKPGILYKDITPVLADPEALDAIVDTMCDLSRVHGATRILGIESRGFIFGAPIACRMGLPFAPIRKPGKLPCETARVEYELEYGSDVLEMHLDAVEPGDRVVIIDDLLATGGTAAAACELVEGQGAEVAAIIVVIELTALQGRNKLTPRQVFALLQY